MLSFITKEDQTHWREHIEYPINTVSMLGSLLCILALTQLNLFGLMSYGSEALSLFLITYPLFCLLRLGFYHLKKPSRLFGWFCGFCDLLFLTTLFYHSGLNAYGLGLFYGVMALHSLRLNALQVLSLGVLSALSIIALSVQDVIVGNPSLALILLLIFTTMFSLFAMKAEVIFNRAAENKAASEAIERTEKTFALKTKVIGEMSDELESPMSRVMSASDALSKTKLTGEQKQYVSVLEQSSAALLSAIENITDFTQMESGALTSKLEPLDLENTLAALAKTFGPKARNKNLDFLIDVEPESEMRLIGYEKRLLQVLSSLVDNAIKFTAKGHVILRVSSKPINSKLSCLNISVEDSGIGLSETQVRALLENHKAEETAKTDRGLGLKIVQMLLGVQGESLKIISTQGEGARFFFELHMPYEAKGETRNKPVQLPAAIRSLKTLIVNDLAEESDILEKQLMAVGMNPQIVSDAQSACVAINAAHNNEKGYNLAIIDYDMPEFDGLRLVELVRSREELNPMKLLIVSSSSVTQIKTAFSKISGTHYLSKPYTQADLTQAIQLLMQPEPVLENRKVA